MSQMLKSSGALAAATMTSRVLGMVREIVYASFMGDGWVAGAFMLAFMVPNLFRRLLGEGALTAAFIPIFKEKEKVAGEKDMWRAANAVISGLVLLVSAIVVLAMVVISVVLLVGHFGNSSLLETSDLKRPGTLATRLQNDANLATQPVSQFLWNQFSPEAKLALARPDVTTRELKSGLAAELNRILQSAPLYDSTRFASFPISDDAKPLLAKNPTGPELVKLNRLLLEEVYPKEILRRGLEGHGQTHLMLRLLRVMFPYVLLVCVAAILMGMCNARGHFFMPAMGAAMLNVVMIASVLWLAPRMGLKLQDQIFALAIGVLVAGVAQASFQMPVLHREGFRFAWVTPWRDETVRRVAHQMLPGIVGVAAYQINVLVTQGIAFWLDTPGAPIVASFNYAVRLMELPEGVSGLSLATYLLPTLAGYAAEKDYGKFRTTLKQGLGYLVFVNLLASLLLVILAEPIIRLLFERREFTSESTLRAAQALCFLAPGLVAFSMVNILARAFYALGDTRTPMKISAVCLSLNVLFAVGLILQFRQRGLGMANTLSACLNVTLLIYALRRKMPKLEFSELRGQVPALLGAAVLAGAAAWAGLRLWETHLGHATFALKLGAVFVPGTAAALTYFAMCWWCHVPSVHEVLGLALGKLKKFRR